jgi:hypothetical protein
LLVFSLQVICLYHQAQFLSVNQECNPEPCLMPSSRRGSSAPTTPHNEFHFFHITNTSFL